MDEISPPFTMQATVTYGEPPPPGWIRIQVSFQIMLSTEILKGGGQRGTPRSGSDAPIALVPHSLRLGTGQPDEDERNWQDFDVLLGALHDEASTLNAAHASQNELDAALDEDWYPNVPVPPWLRRDKLPSFESHDAF